MDYRKHSPKTAFKKLYETSLPDRYFKKIEDDVDDKLKEKIRKKRAGEDVKIRGKHRKKFFKAVCKTTAEYIKSLEKVLLTVIEEKVPKHPNDKTSTTCIPAGMDICQITDMLFPGFQKQVLESAVLGEVTPELHKLCSSSAGDSEIKQESDILEHFSQEQSHESDELLWTLKQLTQPSAETSSPDQPPATATLVTQTQTSPSDFSSQMLKHWAGGSIVYQSNPAPVLPPDFQPTPLVIQPIDSPVSTTTAATASICTSSGSQSLGAVTYTSASSASVPSDIPLAFSDFGSSSSSSSTFGITDPLCLNDNSVYGVLMDEAAQSPQHSFQEFDAFVGLDRSDLELPLEDIDV